MKNLVILCLLAAIGAVLVIETAHAQPVGQQCFTRNGETRCRPTTGPRQFPDGGRLRRDRGMAFPPEFQRRRYFAPEPAPRLVNRCRAFGQRLSFQGFSNVSPIACEGPTYLYRASRGPQLFNIYVSSDTGQIVRLRKIFKANGSFRRRAY